MFCGWDLIAGCADIEWAHCPLSRQTETEATSVMDFYSSFYDSDSDWECGSMEVSHTSQSWGNFKREGKFADLWQWLLCNNEYCRTLWSIYRDPSHRKFIDQMRFLFMLLVLTPSWRYLTWNKCNLFSCNIVMPYTLLSCVLWSVHAATSLDPLMLH